MNLNGDIESNFFVTSNDGLSTEYVRLSLSVALVGCVEHNQEKCCNDVFFRIN